MMLSASSEDTFGFQTITLVYVYKCMDLMKFYLKVQYHKRKVGIDFGGYGTNSLESKGQKGA